MQSEKDVLSLLIVFPLIKKLCLFAMVAVEKPTSHFEIWKW